MPGMEADEKIVVAGGGPAGLAAALYAARAGAAPLVLEGAMPGGRLGQIERIDNYPGFPDGVGGAKLALDMRAQAERFGAKFEPDAISSLAADGGAGLLSVGTLSGRTTRTRVLVVATGTSPRRLGVPGELRFEGRGVSYCATCDGAFFKDRPVAVAGGGAEAFGAALYLARLCSSVALLVPQDVPEAGGAVVAAAAGNPKISVETGVAVAEVLGGPRGVTGLKTVRGGAGNTLETAGLFVAMGSGPALDWDEARLLGRRADGYLETGPDGATNLAGVFAAGDVAGPNLKQVVTAAASGAVAATSALKFLSLAERGRVGAAGAG